MLSSRSAKRFLKHVRQTCKKHGVSFKIGRGKLIRMRPYGFMVAGYFDEDEKVLVCSKGTSQESFLSILVHEFAHLLQWIENEKTYCLCGHVKYGNVQNAICMWISNELTIKDSLVRSYTKKMIACELNAERRAVKLIKQFNLPINLDEYSSSASAGLFTHLMTAKTKQWDFKIGIKQKMASGTSLRRSFKTLPKSVETTFSEA
jgi:hypothetical protein